MSPEKTMVKAMAACGVVALLCQAMPAVAQTIQGLPRTSPHAVVEQTVGIVRVTVDYHRPAVRGREIWGALVPYDTVWRAGANDNTTVTFSDPVRVEGQELAAGTYGLHMIPGRETWTVAFSTNTTSWGSFTYDPEEDALRVEVEPLESPFEERLRYGLDDLEEDSATLSLYWEELRVPIALAFDSQGLVLAKIRDDLRHLPRFSWQGWNSAAAYCLNNNFNFEEALGWADRSIGMDRNGANLLTKAGLLQALDRTDEAAAVEEEALAIATEAQVNNLGYVYLYQRQDVERAIELFKKNVADHPDSWNTYDSLGEGYAAKGETALAIENYAKALEMAPENQKARITAVLEGLKNP